MVYDDALTWFGDRFGKNEAVHGNDDDDDDDKEKDENGDGDDNGGGGGGRGLANTVQAYGVIVMEAIDPDNFSPRRTQPRQRERPLPLDTVRRPDRERRPDNAAR